MIICQQFLTVATLLLQPGFNGRKGLALITAASLQPPPLRLSTALLLSLLAHALLLSLSLGGQTFGLGLNLPWDERRLGANDLRILLAPAQPPAPTLLPVPPSGPPLIKPDEMLTAAAAPVITSNATPTFGSTSSVPPNEVASAPLFRAPMTAPAIPTAPVPVASKLPDVNLATAPEAPQVRARADAEARDVPTTPVEVPASTTPADAETKQIAMAAQERKTEQIMLEREQLNAERLRQAELTATAQKESAQRAQLRQEAVRAEQTERNAAARLEAERQELARQETAREEARRQAQILQNEKTQQEAARLETERMQAARQEQARQAQLEEARQSAAKQEAARQMAAKQETARQEAARQQAAREEAARQETALQEAARREAARQLAAQQEAAKQAAARQEAARQAAADQESAKQEAARQQAAKQEAARQESAQQDRAKQDAVQRERAEQEAKREERLRAIGKQLDAEAAQRDGASKAPSRSLLPGISGLRRGWLLGRANPNRDLVQYAEAMSRKIELNMTFDMVKDLVKQTHTQPVVTVAIRADGSVEKVTFEVSSGVPAIDEAIRNVVASQAPYAKFAPGLASQYDVIEIRRTWIFDVAIRLQ